MDIYDIIIIGAGPSGSIVVKNLDKKYKTLLLDKRELNLEKSKKKGKSCGGLLAPDAQKALAQLKLAIPKKILTTPQMFSVKTVDFNTDITKYYQRHYINIDRELFDRWLISLIPKSVDKKFNTFFKSYKIGSDKLIEVHFLDQNKEVKRVKTKILIGADGGGSKVRKITFNNNFPKKYISIQHHFKTEDIMPHFISIFDKDITDFYSWIIQKENHLLVGTAIPDLVNYNKKYNILIDKLKKRGYIEGDPIKKESALILRPRKLIDIKLFKNSVALVGEAAGLISPSSAEGISYALNSGSILAETINKNFTNFGKFYNRSLTKLKLNILSKNVKLHFIYNDKLRDLIMRSNIFTI